MKKIIETIKRKWAEYLLEVVVIVGSILGAFALEQWNENLNNHKIKSEMLESLQIEFQNNLQQLDSVLYYDSLVLSAAIHLLGYQLDQLDKSNTAIIRLHLANMGFIWTFNPSYGSLRSGISTSNINLIENSELLSLLFGWEDIVRDAEENELRAANHSINENIVSKHIRFADINRYYNPEIGQSDFASDYKGLFKDPHFEDFLSIRIVYISDAIEELTIVQKMNKRILNLLELELKKLN